MNRNRQRNNPEQPKALCYPCASHLYALVYVIAFTRAAGLASRTVDVTARTTFSAKGETEIERERERDKEREEGRESVRFHLCSPLSAGKLDRWKPAPCVRRNGFQVTLGIPPVRTQIRIFKDRELFQSATRCRLRGSYTTRTEESGAKSSRNRNQV